MFAACSSELLLRKAQWHIPELRVYVMMKSLHSFMNSSATLYLSSCEPSCTDLLVDHSRNAWKSGMSIIFCSSIRRALYTHSGIATLKYGNPWRSFSLRGASTFCRFDTKLDFGRRASVIRLILIEVADGPDGCNLQPERPILRSVHYR